MNNNNNNDNNHARPSLRRLVEKESEWLRISQSRHPPVWFEASFDRPVYVLKNRLIPQRRDCVIYGAVTKTATRMLVLEDES